jgi:hypothetical protein
VTARLVAWIPGATVLLTLLVSPYSLEDFANASQR